MKKIFRYIIPCLTVATVFVSCKDDNDTKSYIDSMYETGTTTEVASTAEPEVIDYQSASLTATLNDLEDVVECGFEVATKEDFSDAVPFAAEIDSTAKTFTTTAEGLEGSTTYYARSYVISKAGGTVFGETQTFTTPRVPIFDINTTFLVHELEYDSDNAAWVPQIYDGVDEGYYLMSIDFIDEDKKDVVITGFIGFDTEIIGEWDEETQTVSVPAQQILGEHPTYGAMFFMGLNQVPPTAYTQTVEFHFTPMGGSLMSSPYSLNVSAGYFGFYRFEAVPYEPEEETED